MSKRITEKLKAYYIDLAKDRRKGATAALFCFFLLLFSFVYGFLLRLILFCYDIKLFKSYKPDCRVISVGNITWGGTGKTPLVEALVRFLKQRGGNPAVLIRGYGKDEVYMLKDKFKDVPVLAGRDRIKSAADALRRYCADTLILDDGFQHWRLRRDLDIVLIDSQLPFGNRRLIPRGILREPLTSLRRADVFLLTRSNLAKEGIEPLKEELRRYNRNAPVYEAMHLPCSLRSLTSGEKTGPSTIKNQRIAVVAGIENPRSFTGTLSLLGAEISLKFYFCDHHRYSKKDLKTIERLCLENRIETVITTEKDAARLIPLLDSARYKFKILALGIELKITGGDEEQSFYSLVSGKSSKRPYSVLILSDGKAGHLNQSKAVAKIIKQKRKLGQGMRDSRVSAKIVEVKFRNGFCRLLLNLSSIFSAPACRSCLLCLRFCLKKRSFRELMETPANIIVSAGSSLSSVNLFLSYKNSARNVVLMKPPFLGSGRFDLVIAPEHDRIKPRDNVLLTRIAPNLIDREYLQEQANILNTQYAIRLPAGSPHGEAVGKAGNTQYETKGPTIGVFIGGDTAKYRLTYGLINNVISRLKEAADNLDCRLLISTSRRTPEIAERLLKENFADFPRCKLLLIANEKNIPEAVGGILGLSDIILVSGESISMVSEAVSAQKYTLVFNPQKRTRASTKQERFLQKLEKDGLLKVVQPDSLLSEIKNLWKEKPCKKKIEDEELVYQGLAKIA